MEYLFRLPDGRRLALWSERNQIVRLISGGGNRSQSVLRNDFLSDLSAAMHDGKIYFVYQNTASMVMLHLPDDEEDILLFGERMESCRHSGLKLTAWQESLYLFYAAWNPVREKYALKMRELPMSRTAAGAENGSGSAMADNISWREMELLRDLDAVPAFHVLAEENSFCVLLREDCLRLTRMEGGEECWESGRWLSEEVLDGLRTKNSELDEKRSSLQNQVSELEEERDTLKNKITELQTANRRLAGQQEATQNRLTAAINQYNELAELTKQLQTEGKKWRDRYYQETKKKERSGAVRVKRVSEKQP